jgi:hypothetical protein
MMLMDMDFKGRKKPAIKLDVKDEEPKELPGYRGSSELPEHSANVIDSEKVSDQDIADAFGDDDIPLDPTDLTLDREKAATAGATSAEESLKPKKKASKKQLFIMLGLLLLVVLGAGGFLVYDKVLNKTDKTTVTDNSGTKTFAKTDKPATAPAPITGIDVTPDAAKKPVTAIMIENSIDARPQSGLYDADMVVEAVAEGGITRFVALFQQGEPQAIGPIRSARPYYVDIARTFDAAYVHAGGSDDGLQRIKELGVKDMSAFEDNGTYIRTSDRAAPHNLYSAMSNIDLRRTQLGFTTSTFTPWKHKNDTAQTPSASVAHFNMGSPAFNADFTYDPATNSYLRSEGGEPQLDAKAGKQVQPKVIIGLITSKGQNGSYSTYRLTGSGDMQVFQDGIVSTGTWTKDSPSAQFVFKDKNGLEFAFNKGQVWMTLLGSSSDISVQP